MKNLIEKIKVLDKKVLIGASSAVAVVSILIIVLVIGSGNNGQCGSTQENSQSESQTESQSGTDLTETEGTETQMTESQMTESQMTETQMTETQMTESESQSESTKPSSSQKPSESQSQPGTTVTQPEDVNGVEQKPVTTTSDGVEILGTGTADDPYEVFPDASSMALSTLDIPAGETRYYSIRGAGNMWFSINDGDAYVIESNGTRHNPSSGKIGFKAENALASDYVLFQIGNSGSSAKSFTIQFSNIKGSWQNPEKITSAGAYNIHLEAGEEVGYHYKYIVEKAGAIRFYIVAESSTCGLTVTNNSNMAQRTFQAEVQQDGKGRYVELEADKVSVGDEIVIIVCAEKYRGKIPAADVTWEIVYVE